MSWDPGLYTRFQAERTQPFLDLMARVPPRPYRRIADLGCGPGTHTNWLGDHYPSAHVTGVDNSAEMLRVADHGHPRLRFVERDLTGWQAEEACDLIVSNAAYHWIPDHLHLLPHLLSSLAPGGVFAFQVPANHDAPSHQAIQDVAADPEWADIVRPRLPPGSVLELDAYHALFAAHGCEVDAWDHVYQDRVPGISGMVAWLSGTTLHAVLAALSPGDADEFRARLSGRLAAAYGDADVVTFPFRRRFVVATDQIG